MYVFYIVVFIVLYSMLYVHFLSSQAYFNHIHFILINVCCDFYCFNPAFGCQILINFFFFFFTTAVVASGLWKEFALNNQYLVLSYIRVRTCIILGTYEHVCSPTRQKDRQKQITYSAVKHSIQQSHSNIVLKGLPNTFNSISLDKNKV